ncbi:hypothetical protein L3i23_20850 [Herbiconiux sp. L3-i23]|nr:hypothetical protein L3i23_20850 [Herbiconiux sp. L3-i23]
MRLRVVNERRVIGSNRGEVAVGAFAFIVDLQPSPAGIDSRPVFAIQKGPDRLA